MRRRNTARAGAVGFMMLATVALLAAPRPASANYLISIQKTQSGILATGSGSVTLTDVAPSSSSATPGIWAVAASPGLIIGGPQNQTMTTDNLYGGTLVFNPQTSTGNAFTTQTNQLFQGQSGGGIFSGSNYDIAGVYFDTNASGYPGPIYNLVLPRGYEYGTSFTVSELFPGVTQFSEIGLVQGTYNFLENMGMSAGNTDIFTIQIGPSSESPVPEPTTVLLLGLGLICLAGLLRKSKRQIHIA